MKFGEKYISLRKSIGFLLLTVGALEFFFLNLFLLKTKKAADVGSLPWVQFSILGFSEEDAYGDEITHHLPLHPKEPQQ